MQLITVSALFVIVAVGCVSALGYEEHWHYPKYEYKYGVKDPHTHDHKEAWEHGDGGHVKGGYSLDESDGTHRVVEYHADPKLGANTIVKRLGHAHHPHHGTSYQQQNLYVH